MLQYEQAHCKNEKERRQQPEHEVTGKSKLGRSANSSKSADDLGNVRHVEKKAGDRRRRADSRKSVGSSSCSNKSTTSTSPSSSSSSSSSHRKRETTTYKNRTNSAIRPTCFDEPAKRKREPCNTDFKWQHAEYCRDECGSGIRPVLKMNFERNRKMWCATPLSVYQSTIGELARKILCNEFQMRRNVHSPPPCNVCEYVLPLCRDYYRKYDCVRGCEEEYAKLSNGKKVYRDRVQRYWEPCATDDHKAEKSIRHYASHNAHLGDVLRRKFHDSVPCW